jgi:hypothetical protein
MGRPPSSTEDSILVVILIGIGIIFLKYAFEDPGGFLFLMAVLGIIFLYITYTWRTADGPPHAKAPRWLSDETCPPSRTSHRPSGSLAESSQHGPSDFSRTRQTGRSGTGTHNKIISLVATDIQLIPSTHQYVLASDKTLKFKSVTEVIAEHFEPFDSQRIAKNLVENYPKYARYTVDELIAKWKAKTDRGTFVHNEVQTYIEDGTEPTSKISKHGARWFDRNILGPSSTYGSECFCEVFVFDEDLGIAGLIDLLVCDKKTGNAYIFDWKTSKKIDRRGYNGKTGTTNATRTLQDCQYSKYALQTTLYRYILEKRFHIPIRASYIIHLTPSQRKLGKDGAQLIETEYLKMNAEKILAMM